MPARRMVVTAALLLGACCAHARPAYPGSDSGQALMPMDVNLAGGAAGDSEAPAGLQPPGNLRPALSAPGDGASHGQKAARAQGDKSTLQEDDSERPGEDFDVVLWKAVAKGELQSQEFTRAERAPRHPSKRACFWKYCVTK